MTYRVSLRGLDARSRMPGGWCAERVGFVRDFPVEELQVSAQSEAQGKSADFVRELGLFNATANVSGSVPVGTLAPLAEQPDAQRPYKAIGYPVLSAARVPDGGVDLYCSFAFQAAVHLARVVPGTPVYGLRRGPGRHTPVREIL